MLKSLGLGGINLMKFFYIRLALHNSSVDLASILD